MQPYFTDSQFPAEPYPGARPDCSFVHLDGVGYAIGSTPGGGWQLHDGSGLDDRLAGWDAPPMAGRTPVLAYGSNACPSKITWLRGVHELRGPVVVLRVVTVGVAAVWASGLRIVDDQRPATLTADPGRRESHAVWLADADQLVALDRCEGLGVRYDRVVLGGDSTTVEIRDEVGIRLADVQVYLGRSASRMPLLVDGRAVRCADVPQARARVMQGVPAASDGLRPRPSTDTPPVDTHRVIR